MKNLPLLHWMEDIDPVLIERADNYRPVHRKPYWRTVLIAAAALLLLTVVLSAFAAWRVDTYVQTEYPDIYDGTLLHALDIVLTQDENAVSSLLGEQNKRDLHSLFNALRGVIDDENQTEDQQTQQGPYSKGLEYRSRGDGTCSVVGIGECTDLHVVIPKISPDGEIVVDIAEGAFENNITVTKVTLPDTVKTIRENAFSGCSKLEKINLPDSVTMIGTQAFRSCWRLTELHIPKNVTDIGENIVGMCIMLESITVAPENTVYKSEENCLIEIASCTLIAGCQGSVIPDGVTSIAPYAFYCIMDLRSVAIPEGVTSIGKQAFLGCSRLREVTLPTTLKSIGEQAFAECTVLNGITLFEGLESIGTQAFEKCEKLTSVALPNSLKMIDDAAFLDCKSLVEINIPHGITEIADDTFYGCTSLARVFIPDSVQKIGSYAFYNCEALTQIHIPNSVMTIGNCAFNGCSALSAVDLSPGLSGIGTYVFADCDSLTEITIPTSIAVIPAYAFYDCDGLISMTLPESVVKIEQQAFASCDALESVYIPAGVTNIKERVFYNCPELHELVVASDNPQYKGEGNCLIDTETAELLFANTHSVIPSGVRKIGTYAVSNTTLRRITLPDGVEVIEDYALYRNWDMVSVVIPASVTKIGDYVFELCVNLRNVYYAGTEEQWAQITVGQENQYLLDATVIFEYVPE